MERLKQYQTLLLRIFKHFPRLSRRVRTWLLKQNVFPSAERFHGPFIMKTIRQLRQW